MIALVTATHLEMLGVLAQNTHSFCTQELATGEAGYNAVGSIGNIPVHICIIGVGPVLSSYIVGQFLAKNTISFLVCCGIAGTYSEEICAIGTVAFVVEDIYGEYGIRRENTSISVNSFPFYHSRQDDILERLSFENPKNILEEAGLCFVEAPYVCGVTLAGVSGDMKTALAIQQNYPDADIETMEGFSIGLAGALSAIPVVQIRAISNRAGMRSGWQIDKALSVLSKTIYGMCGGI